MKYQSIRFTALIRKSLCATVLAASGMPAMLAQTAGDQRPALPGPHDYITGLNETVSPADGQLTLRIDVPLPPGRKLNVPFSISYSSNGLYSLNPVWGSYNTGGYPYNGVEGLSFSGSQAPYGSFSSGGWSYSVPQLSVVSHQVSATVNNDPVQCNWFSNFVFSDPSGQPHLLGLDYVQYEELLNNQLTTQDCINIANLSSYPKVIQGAPKGYNSGGDDVYNATLPSPLCSVQPVVVDHSGTVFQFPCIDPYFGSSLTVPSSYPASSIEDDNGNIVNISTTGTGYGPLTATYQDTLQRQLLKLSMGTANTPDTIVVSGVPNAYSLTWSAETGSGAPTPKLGLPPNVNSPSHCTQNVEPSLTSTSAVSRIELPNGQSYAITYDPVYTGLIQKITYPTGAWVEYTWGINSQSQYGVYQPEDAIPVGYEPGPADTNVCPVVYDTYSIVERDVSPDGSSSPALTQKFKYQTTLGIYGWTTKTTTVTNIDNIRNTTTTTIYTYTGVPAPVDPNAWVTANTIYNDTATIPLETQIQYDNVKTVTKTWATPSQLSCEVDTVDSLSSGTLNSYDLNFNLAETRAYDYGAIQASACNSFYGPNWPASTPLKDTVIAYQTFSPTPIYPSAPSIVSSPNSVTVTGSGGNSSVTTFGYNNSVTADPAGIPINHDQTNYSAAQTSPRGNPTTITRQCVAGSAPCTNSNTSFTYDEAGQVLSVTDSCAGGICSDMVGLNHTTVYSYKDTFTYTSPGETNAFVTAVTNPLSQVEKYSWTYATGELANSIDENNNKATYCYTTGGCSGSSADPFNRLTETDYPDGGKVNIYYSDSVPSVQTTVLQTPNPAKTSVTIMDGMWRAIQTQTSEPGGADVVTTTYDGSGRVFTKTNPFLSSSQPSTTLATPPVGTSSSAYYYDTLGRPTEIIEPGPSTLTWCYDGITSAQVSNCPNIGGVSADAWVDSWDEKGNLWQRTSDGLGRLVQVVEPGSLVTGYVYDALSNLLKVNQLGNAANGDTARTRTFTYNSLSQLITSFNPESGNVTYAYDLNGNLSRKTDARGITTVYTYDALNRVLSKSYSDGATPLSCHQYDTSSATPSKTPPNWTGRLTNSWTQYYSATPACSTTGAFLTKRSILAYDPMGRILNEQQFTPSSQAGGTLYLPAYTYDLAGNLTFSTTGIGPTPTAPPITLSYTYDGAGRLQTVNNPGNTAINGVTPPASLFAPQTAANPPCANSVSGQYTAFGGLANAALGNGLTLNRSYDIRLRTTCENDK